MIDLGIHLWKKRMSISLVTSPKGGGEDFYVRKRTAVLSPFIAVSPLLVPNFLDIRIF